MTESFRCLSTRVHRGPQRPVQPVPEVDGGSGCAAMQKVKVSPPAADGSVLYARLAPTPPRFAQPSLKTRVTLACFCAQVHAQSGHCSSFLGQEQCRASSQRVPGRHGRSVCSRDQSACARQHAEGCEASGVCSSRVRSGVMQQTQTACDLLMCTLWPSVSTVLILMSVYKMLPSQRD